MELIIDIGHKEEGDKKSFEFGNIVLFIELIGSLRHCIKPEKDVTVTNKFPKKCNKNQRCLSWSL